MNAADTYGAICLIPIAVIIVLSLITKKTFEPLLISVIVAVVIYAKGDFLGEFVNLLLKEMADPTIGWVILVCGLMGALLFILEKSNAASAFADLLGRFATTRKRALFATWFLGICLFIDDYLNVLTVGNTMKKVTDKHNISRSMLAYSVGSTAAPIVILVPISTWAIFFASLLANEGIVGADGTAVGAYIQCLPYLFYGWICVFIVLPLVILGIIPLVGPMRSQELHARETGDLFPPGVEPPEAEAEQAVEEGKKQGGIWDFILPLAVLIAVTIAVGNDVLTGVKEVFPFSKMMDTIKYNQPMTTEFYFYNGRVSASTRHPLMRDGKMVGCLEYDLFEDMELVESFIEHYIDLDDELKYFKEEAQRFRRTKYSIDNIVGYSTKMLDLKEKIRYIARNNSTVLIHGETGTGKELVAHSIHNLSKRRLRNFIKINSAGLPESLAESELFGYEDGAFTGAKKGGKKGKFELADGGTLFIDEVNQMPLTLQPKLLRVLQEKEVERIGGTKSIPVDVRIIAATNQDLKKLIAEEKFREDLFYRLNVVEIRIPPLRERRDDIPHLARQFVETYNGLFGKHIERIDDRTLKRLMDYDWPGNIRELQNTIERSMNYAEGTVLTDEALDFDVFTEKQSVEMLKGYPKPIEEVLMQTERNLIQRTLEMFGGNKTKAAEFLKIPRTLLYQKMKRLGMK